MGYANRPAGKVVLVVEDDPMIRFDSVSLIENAGYEVLEATNAEEAIALLETRMDIAVVFTDVEMPGEMNGIKLARAIRDRWPPVHLIIASAHSAALAQEIPDGSHVFLKPYDGSMLIAAIAEMAKAPRPTA